jgi:hypothetical protein
MHSYSPSLAVRLLGQNSSTVSSLRLLTQLKRIDKDLYLWVSESNECSFAGDERVDVFLFYCLGCFQKNAALEALTLPALEVIGGQFDVLSNPLLKSLAGLEKLRSVNGHIKVWSNEAMTSLAGLDSLQAVGGFEILVSVQAADWIATDATTAVLICVVRMIAGQSRFELSARLPLLQHSNSEWPAYHPG